MLIEVTGGARAAGSQPDKTDFMARLQQLFILENAVKIPFFSGFNSI